jgi:hypothetical protein
MAHGWNATFPESLDGSHVRSQGFTCHDKENHQGVVD